MPLPEVGLDAVALADVSARSTIRRTHDNREQPVTVAGQNACGRTRARWRCRGEGDELETVVPIESDVQPEMLQLERQELKAQGGRIIRCAVEPFERDCEEDMMQQGQWLRHANDSTAPKIWISALRKHYFSLG